MFPPASRIGTITDGERAELVKQSSLYGTYEQTIDRESAYELIQKRTAEKLAQQTPSDAEKMRTHHFFKSAKRKEKGPSTTELLLSTTAKTLNSRIGQQIIRGILGSNIWGQKITWYHNPRFGSWNLGLFIFYPVSSIYRINYNSLW